MTLQVYKTAQTNAQAWQSLDKAIISSLNILLKQAYPTYTLKDYANPASAPATPADGDVYLVDASGTCWGLTVTEKQLIARVSGAWTTLTETLETLTTKITSVLTTGAASTFNGNLKGLATTATNPTVVAGQPQFYIASGTGTYTNFGGLVVSGNFALLIYNGTAWSKYETTVTAPNVVQNSGTSTTNVMSQNLVSNLNTDNEIAIARSSNDLAFYNGGIITINNTAKNITVSGGILNRKGQYQVIN